MSARSRYPPLHRGSIRIDLHARWILSVNPITSGAIRRGQQGVHLTPDVYVPFLPPKRHICHLHHSSWPRVGEAPRVRIWQLIDHGFSFALWAHHIDLIGRSLHADIALIRRSTLASALYDSCRGCCPQCLVAPFHCVCLEAALV
jgi:hypothetical protein